MSVLVRRTTVKFAIVIRDGRYKTKASLKQNNVDYNRIHVRAETFSPISDMIFNHPIIPE